MKLDELKYTQKAKPTDPTDPTDPAHTHTMSNN